MRFIPTGIHGYLDYATAVLLVAMPFMFGFAEGAAMLVPFILGISVLTYSVLTSYELGLVPVISMPTHLWLDGLGGALLAVSPWLFGFSDFVWVPHLLVGLFEIGAALTTVPVAKWVPNHPAARAHSR